MPPRIAALLRDHRGYPIPWFVSRPDGVPNFAAADRRKLEEAKRRKVCWTCGDPMGQHKVFVIGPMCCVNRVSAEPPSHLACAAYSVVACPFLVRPQMKRLRQPEGSTPPPGEFLERNPGVTALWTTREFHMQAVPGGGELFALGQPSAIAWYREGRAATLAEVSEAIATGMPALQALAEQEGPEAMVDLLAAVQQLLPLLPRSDA